MEAMGVADKLVTIFTILLQNRFRFLNRVFNQIDHQRRGVVGPDRSCAEWILRNGGSVRFKIQNELVSNYDQLVSSDALVNTDHLVEIYAHDASVNGFGFAHFENCKHIKRITLISCRLIDDEAMEVMPKYLKDTLNYFEMRGCHLVTDKGLLHLGRLSNLNTLVLQDLKGVTDALKVEAALRSELKNAQITMKV